MIGSDLYGAVGFPRCLTRTVIVGKDAQLVEQILRVLTYFIRCSELTENTEECPLMTVDIDVDTTTLMSTSDTPTPVSCPTADVTLTSSSVSAGVKTASSSISAEKAQLTVSDGSPVLVLKPAPGTHARDTPSSSASKVQLTATCDAAPSSHARGTHVRFQNGDRDTSRCRIGSAESEDLRSRTERTASTTAAVVEQSVRRSTNTRSDSGLLLCFRSDVSEALPPLSGLTCSGCDYVRPCDDCSEALRKADASQTYVDDIGKRKPPCCSARSDPVVRRNSGEVSSPTLCQLSPVEAIENVHVERVAHVGREPAAERRSQLHRVPLEKPSAVSSPGDSRHTSTPSPEDQTTVRRLPQYKRGNSIFDEYFDGTVIDLCTGPTFGADDTSTFDEIMNEPCPDVSHIDVSQRSGSTSSTEVVPEPPVEENNTIPPSSGVSDMLYGQLSGSSGLSEVVPGLSLDNSTVPLCSGVVSDPIATFDSVVALDSDAIPLSSRVPETASDPIIVEPTSLATFDNVFVEQHFAAAAMNRDEQHLDDIPDGPSRQLISSAIKLMQDLRLDSQTSQSSADDLDVPAADYFSQTGLGPSPRGRQRHPSGQSNTSAARCR